MLAKYETADRHVIAGWLKREKFHHDGLLRMEFKAKEGKLVPAD